MAVKQEFESRFAKHKDELEWLFMELYHNREGLEVLEREMAEAYNARSAELKALDKARSADPEWYKRGNMFGMTMYTDLFAGNLKELAKKLPYLKEQKLTYLHLMPLLQMPHPHNDGGYAVEDFDTRRLDSRHQQGSGKPDPGAAESRHQPVSGFCDESHRQHPPLGDGGKGGRPVVSGLLPPLRGPHHPRPVRADCAPGVPQHRARQLLHGVRR